MTPHSTSDDPQTAAELMVGIIEQDREASQEQGPE